jgi:hypothetical protein
VRGKNDYLTGGCYCEERTAVVDVVVVAEVVVEVVVEAVVEVDVGFVGCTVAIGEDTSA